MARARFVPNHAAIQRLMTAQGVVDRVVEVAHDVARAAAAGGGQFRVDHQTGPKRHRAAVIGDYTPGTTKAESREKLLRGLDGAAAGG